MGLRSPWEGTILGVVQRIQFNNNIERLRANINRGTANGNSNKNVPLKLWVIVWRCLREPTFSHFGRGAARDRQRERRTHDDSIYRASIASRGKNWMLQLTYRLPACMPTKTTAKNYLHAWNLTVAVKHYNSVTVVAEKQKWFSWPKRQVLCYSNWIRAGLTPTAKRRRQMAGDTDTVVTPHVWQSVNSLVRSLACSLRGHWSVALES